MGVSPSPVENKAILCSRPYRSCQSLCFAYTPRFLLQLETVARKHLLNEVISRAAMKYGMGVAASPPFFHQAVINPFVTTQVHVSKAADTRVCARASEAVSLFFRRLLFISLLHLSLGQLLTSSDPMRCVIETDVS